jgi:HlyD family secretion protein
VTYVVVITAGNDTLQLYPGMTAMVDIKVTEHRDVLRVPSAALRFRPTPSLPSPAPRRAGESEVYVLDSKGLFTAVPVKVGIADTGFSEIAGGTLTEGQQVVVGRKPSAGGAGT